MATVSSGLTLSTDYFLRQYYSSNSALAKNSNRKKYTQAECQYSDSKALSRAASKISTSTFSEEDNSETTANNITAFLNTYNNSISSGSDSNAKRYANQLKSLAKKYSKELEEIGITVNANGTMTANQNLLKSADVDKINDLFSKDSELVKSSKRISKRINSIAFDSLYAQMTGTGINISIRL